MYRREKRREIESCTKIDPSPNRTEGEYSIEENKTHSHSDRVANYLRKVNRFYFCCGQISLTS